VGCPLITRCRVPAALDPVTSIGRSEADPRDVGVDPAGLARIWGAAESLYRSGMHPALQLCVRHQGAIILDRAIGHAVGNGPDDPPEAPKVLATTETPFCIFSASKAVTAMLIHLLDERNLIRLDDPVCEYIPEFAVHTKQWITIRHILIHRAGMANPPPGAMDIDILASPEEILHVLCELPQAWRPGRQLAYHAITGGFILGEIVRRVTGRDIREFIHDEIRRPLGLRWMSYGTDAADAGRVARNYFTGPPPLPPLSIMLRRALGIDFRRVIEISNDPRFLAAVVPSGNLVATAGELSRFFELLLEGGALGDVRIFDPRTIRRAVGEQSYFEIDFTLALPFRYGMGFMLGADWLSLYGPDTRYAFGHLGFTNVVAWADPERDVAAALLTSGKPLLYAELYHFWDVMRQIGIACHKVRRPWADLCARPRPHPTRGAAG
jgi:CubicO group peptidase (beta-lactamase class C family)